MKNHLLVHRYLYVLTIFLCPLSAAISAESIYKKQLAELEHNPKSLFAMAGQCSSITARIKLYETVSTQQRPIALAYRTLMGKYPELDARYVPAGEIDELYRNVERQWSTIDISSAPKQRFLSTKETIPQRMLLFVIDTPTQSGPLLRPSIRMSYFHHTQSILTPDEDNFVILIPRTFFTSMSAWMIEQLVVTQLVLGIASFYEITPYIAWPSLQRYVNVPNDQSQAKTILRTLVAANPALAPTLCDIYLLAQREDLRRKIKTTARITAFFRLNNKPAPKALESRAASLQKQSHQLDKSQTSTPTLEAVIDFFCKALPATRSVTT